MKKVFSYIILLVFFFTNVSCSNYNGGVNKSQSIDFQNNDTIVDSNLLNIDATNKNTNLSKNTSYKQRDSATIMNIGDTSR